jgi:hypothetical protein
MRIKEHLLRRLRVTGVQVPDLVIRKGEGRSLLRHQWRMDRLREKAPTPRHQEDAERRDNKVL